MDIKKLTKDFLKTRVAGAGDDVVLEPPINTSQLLMSVESFSVIDLLAEGPIGGIVDKYGAYAEGDRILCGVYIDQVPIRETISSETFIYNEFPTGIDATQPSASNLSGIADILNQYDSDFQSIYRTSDEISDLDKFIASGAYRLNKDLAAALKYSADEDAALLRGGAAFFSSDDIKYAFIPASAIDISNLNITKNNTNIRVMYSGTNGTVDLLSNRYRRNSNNSGQFNQMVVSHIPNPIINLAYQTASNQTNNATALRGGYVLIPIASGDTLTVTGGKVTFTAIDDNCIDLTSAELSGASIFLQAFREDTTNTYNYDKIDVELRNGTEDQSPLSNVQQTSRSYDTAFELQGAIKLPDSYSDTYDPLKVSQLSPSTANQAYTSSSRRIEGNYDYASWAKSSFNNYTDERATFTHIIENPAVSQVSATFTLGSLYDTVVTDTNDKAGTQTVALVEMGIEIGLEGDTDPNDPLYNTLRQYHKTITFGIEGLVRSSPFRFRVGGSQKQSRSTWIAPTSGTSNKDLDELPLPPEIQGRKRYIKIYRKTPETFSSKRAISISLSAINEYYGKNFSYPLSALSGVKIDSRAFSRVPSRSYDLRLKKVLIPSNYYPLYNDGRDKRFIDNKNDLSTSNPPKIYNGDWDGTFRYDWTDNPAWILYDMLVDPVYAIGNQLDDLRDINIWQLYEIGRFCDAVNTDGEFVGVDDGYGGLEPRFSCNVMLNNEQEAFDILNSIATIFRGTVFYAGSDIDFYYDVEDEPVAIFNNYNVEGGSFTYADSLKSSRYTVVEVPYIDKKDNFLQKIEYYEDEESIQRYGYIKYTFQGIGTTSRGQAQRFAKYALLSNKLETETVQFTAGREAMLLQPSDVIRVDDELKNLQAVGNYVADVDYDNKQIILPYIPTGGLDTGIYLYCATGENSLDQLFQEAYDNEQKILQGDIDDLNTKKIKYFGISSYAYTGTSNGGTGLVINLDTGQSGIEKFNDVMAGSFCSIKATGRNDHLYKIVSMSEESEDKVGIMASQYEPRKFQLVESGIRFSQEEEYFANLSVDYNDNTPDPPASVTLVGGVTITDNRGGLYLTGSIIENSTFPVTEKYECHLTTPKGNKNIKTVYNESPTETVVFGPLYEFGKYYLSVYGESAAPLKLRSVSAAETSATINLNDISPPYAGCVIENISFFKGVGEYSPPTVSQTSTGSFELYQGSLNIAWSIRDRIGKVITTSDEMRTNSDNPVVSMDIVHNGVYIAKDWIYRSKDVSAVISKEQLSAWFEGTIPRTFQIVLRVDADSQGIESDATITITNPEPSFNSVRASSAYDSIANGFRVWASAEKRYRDDIEKIYLYTGNNANFDPDTGDGALFLELEVGQNAINARKSSLILNDNFYPEIADNTLLTIDSLRDSLFYNGEKVEINRLSNIETLPSGLSDEIAYELVMGRTFDSVIFLDADRGYYDDASGIPNQSYLNDTGSVNINQGYYPFQRLVGVTSNTAGGTGLITGENAGYRYPIISQSVNGVYIYNTDYATYGSSGWVYTDYLPGGAVSGYIANDIGGYKEWSGTWVYFLAGGYWVYVLDTEYSFGALANVGKFETSKHFNIRDRNGFRLAEEKPSLATATSMFQTGWPVMSFSAWVRPSATNNKMYLFDCGGESGGWSFYLSGKETAGEASGDYRLDIRLSDGAGSTGELITIESSSQDKWEIGKWTHFGASFYTVTGAGGNTGYANFYVNGQLDASGTASGSGIAPHLRACGIGTQMGQSVSGAGNDGQVSTWTDNYFKGDVTDVGIYNAKFSTEEMQEIFYGIRNQYACKVSTGNYHVQEVTGNNVDNIYELSSLENSVIRLEINNAAGPSDVQQSVLEKIDVVNRAGVAKQFTFRSNVSSTNTAFNNLINSTFYLEEVNYLNQNYVWQNLSNPDIYMQYISGGSFTTHGAWIMYSGATGNIVYQYTGSSATDAGYIDKTSLEAASGYVPINAVLKTGSYAATIGLPESPSPRISNTNTTDGKAVLFADFYLRMKAEDYLGPATDFYPRAGLPAILINYAEIGEQSAKTKATSALVAGEQLQNLIETIQKAAADNVDYTGFAAALAAGGFVDQVSTPVSNETTAESYRTTTPEITTSLSFTQTISDAIQEYDSVSIYVSAFHPNSNASIYLSTDKSDVLLEEAGALASTYISDQRYKRRLMTLYWGDAVYCTARVPGKALSDIDSETVEFSFVWDGIPR